MGITVYSSRHGNVAFRIFWRGKRAEFGVKAAATEATLRFFQAKAILIGDDLERGRPLHLALIEHLGDCPPRLVPGHEKRRRADVTFRAYFEEWMSRKAEEVSASAAKRYRRSWTGVLLPLIGEIAMRDFTPARLRDLRTALAQPSGGKRRAPKTLRNIIDWHLKALWNDAMNVDEIVTHNPFPKLKWKKQKRAAKPDPFEQDERDRIIAWYWKHDRFWHPFVVWQFWTGMRPGETAALRLSDVDLETGRVTITKSRDEHEEGPPKTRKSEREIELLPVVVAAMRARPAPMAADPDAYLFSTREGKPVTDSWWPKRGWYRCLAAVKAKPRKFYATRHTFISTALSEGVNPVEVAEYCGTSVTMIEGNYLRWIKRGDSLAALRKTPAARRKVSQ